MDTCRSRSRDLCIGGAGRLRCRPRATLYTRFQWTLRHQPQPDVRRLDPTVSRSCSYQAERVDDRIASSCSGIHPPGRTGRRAIVGGGFRGRLRSVQEAGSSISLTAGAERQDVVVLRWYYLSRKTAEARLAPQARPNSTIQRRPALLAKPMGASFYKVLQDGGYSSKESSCVAAQRSRECLTPAPLTSV